MLTRSCSSKNLQRQGIEIIFLNRDIRQTPEDNLLLQMQGMMAEYERAKIMERSRRGKRHAAQAGLMSVLSSAPYGYRYLGKYEGGGQARYEIDKAQAEVVRQIFAWVALKRCSIGEVCRRLQQRGIRSPRGKTYWDRSTVWGMLNNSAYIGKAQFGKQRVGPMRPRLRARAADRCSHVRRIPPMTLLRKNGSRSRCRPSWTKLCLPPLRSN